MFKLNHLYLPIFLLSFNIFTIEPFLNEQIEGQPYQIFINIEGEESLDITQTEPLTALSFKESIDNALDPQKEGSAASNFPKEYFLAQEKFGKFNYYFDAKKLAEWLERNETNPILGHIIQNICIFKLTDYQKGFIKVDSCDTELFKTFMQAHNNELKENELAKRKLELAELYLCLDKPDVAFPLISSCLSIDFGEITYAEAQLALGKYWLAKNEIDLAIDAFDISKEFNQDNDAAYVCRGNALLKKQDYDEAFRNYEQGINDDKSIKNISETLLYFTEIAFVKKDYPLTFYYASTLVNFYQYNLNKKQQAKVYYIYATSLFYRSDFSRASVWFNKALASGGLEENDRFNALLKVANIYFLEKQYTFAYEILSQIGSEHALLQQKPYFFEFTLLLAKIAFALKNYSVALIEFEKLKMEEYDFLHDWEKYQVYTQIAKSYYHTKNYNKAKEYANMVIASKLSMGHYFIEEEEHVLAMIQEKERPVQNELCIIS